MFKNYFKIAYRYLVRDKLYTIISVSGLGIGLACCLLIYLYVHEEWSYDSFHKNTDYIYRMIRMGKESGELSDGSEDTSYLLGTELQETFPEIERTTRISPAQLVVTYGNNSFQESVVHVEPDFFYMFSFPLIHGDAASVLDDPSKVVITPEMAEKYFGDDNPIGKTLTILLGDNSMDLLVTGIIEKAPANSSVQYSFLISTDLLKYTFPERRLQSWNNIMTPTLVQLRPATEISTFEEKVSRHITKLAEEDEGGTELLYKLQSLTDIHLDPRYSGITGASSDPVYSYILSAIALLVLLIACINFMTLAIGRSSSRTREVGLRKVLGAQRVQIMKQFWGEALMLSFAALILGILLTELLLPVFNQLAQKQLSFRLFANWSVFPTLVGLTLVTAFLAGIYPALLLSNLFPVETMRSSKQMAGKNRLIQGLVVLQFVISVFLISSTFIISSQMKYVSNSSLGYDKNLVVTFPTGTVGEDAANLLVRFRNQLSDQTAIVDVSGYSYSIGQSWLYISYSDEGMTALIGEDITGSGYAASAGESKGYFYINWVDPHYLTTMGVKVIEGRNFSEDLVTDTDDALIINQALAKQLGWENPIGHKLPQGFRSAAVVGVVEDFHFYPLHRKIEPLLLHMPRQGNLSSINEIAIRIQSENIPATLSLIENTWTKVSNGLPFSYKFLDDKVAEQYANEQRWRTIVQYSSGLSILVTCLGLFGLTSLAVVKRTREVGIRKVLGASAPNIVSLISREFIILVLFAVVIAGPVAWYIMNRWLENFAYQTAISPWIFLLSGVIALLIALATVSYQAIKAAWTNPIESLRYE